MIFTWIHRCITGKNYNNKILYFCELILHSVMTENLSSTPILYCLNKVLVHAASAVYVHAVTAEKKEQQHTYLCAAIFLSQPRYRHILWRICQDFSQENSSVPNNNVVEVQSVDKTIQKICLISYKHHDHSHDKSHVSTILVINSIVDFWTAPIK